jgi:hypothetical protein
MNKFWLQKMTRQMPGEGTPAGNPAPEPAPVPAPEAGPDLSFIPVDYHVDGKPDLSKFTTHYQDLVAADAQRREAMADVPEDGKYQFALPEDFAFDGIEGLPEGFKVELALDDPDLQPLYAGLSDVLKEIGAPKAAASKLAGLIAKYEAIQYAQAAKAGAAEMAKLGTETQQNARFAAVERGLSTVMPAEEAKAVLGIVRTAEALRGLERLLSPRSMTPPATPPNNNSELAGLSPFERLKRINAQAAKAS